MVAGVADLSAQPTEPNVDIRVIADPGPNNNTPLEPSIAVGQDAVVIVDFREGAKGRYAILNRVNETWYDYAFDYPGSPSGTYTASDLSIAYDPNTRAFVALAYGTRTAGFPAARTDYVFCSRLTPDPNHANGIGVFEAFRAIDEFDPYFDPMDRSIDIPWVAAGEWTSAGREHYCVYWYTSLGNDPNEPNEPVDPNDPNGPRVSWPAKGYRCLRSVDGGETWKGRIVNVNGDPVGGVWCAKPAVYKGRDLFVAYNLDTANEIRFLRGVEPTDPNHVGGITFCALESECELGPMGPAGPFDPVPLLIQPNSDDGHIRDSLPGGQAPGRVPQLLADPTDADHLYIIYHDTKTSGTSDKNLNVYIHEITRTGSADTWCVGQRRPVGPEESEGDADQFMPSAVVDDHGYIHVVYYDDRRYPSQTDGGASSPRPKFDCYYAYSIDGGLNWTEERLDGDDPNDPAVDCEDVNDLREYIGIGWFGDDVVAAFTGSVPYDPNDPPPTNPGVIWSSWFHW